MTPEEPRRQFGRDTSGTQALRRGRVSERGRAYFLTALLDRKLPLLVGEAGSKAAECLLGWQDAGGFLLLAFIVMPEHVHLLGILEADDLGRTFARWKAWSAKEVNAVSGRSGRVWQPGFYDHGIRRSEDLRSVSEYIEGNPVRRGLSDAVESYPLSSANEAFRARLRGWSRVGGY